MTTQEQRQKQAASFGAGAAAYDRARPGYPAAAIDWLIPAGARRVLDLGAGTGKLTRLLVERGLEVSAVDPSTGMLDYLERALPGVSVLEGTAETIPLPDGSLDAVVVGQAWHWFDAARAGAEIARVLRAGGSLGLIWNTRDGDAEHMERFSKIVDRSFGAHGYGGTPVLPAPFGPIATTEVAWTYRLTKSGFLDLAASRSNYLVLPEAEQRVVLDEVRDLFDEVASSSPEDPTRLIDVPYVTRCFRAATGPASG